MKKLLILIFLGMMMLTLSGCTDVQANTEEERVRGVKVQEIAESENPVTLNYIGTIDSKEMIDYSFKTGGEIGKVYVEKGDRVKKGQKLVELNLEDLNFQLDAAKATLDTARLNIKKAEDSWDYNKELFNKMEKLFTEGSISKDQYDQVKLQYDMGETSYNQAKSQYEAANTDYEYKLSLVTDAVLYADQEGIVVDIPYEENERLGDKKTGAVLRSISQILNVGIAQKDLNMIKVGTKALVNVDGVKASGVVSNIDEAPDMATRTYNGEVTLNEKNFRLGSIAKVAFDIGKEKGVWIPMTSISSNGEDYVYIIQGERAFKRTVELQKVHDDKIMVTGVKPGELLAIGGMKNLNDGAKIKIAE